MVAVGLISILLMSVLSLGQMINTQSRRAADLEDLNNVTKQVASLLADQANCLNLYGGTPVTVTNIGSGSTPQLEVSAKEPYTSAGPMTGVSSGRIQLYSLKMQLKRKLSGVGGSWYQGDAMVYADDSPTSGNFAPRKVPVNFQIDGTGNVVACAAAGLSITSAASNGLAFGQCGNGQVMVGMDATGVICKGGGQTSSGKGCTGDHCVTSDGGPCYGPSCMTNGWECTGDSCTACGTFPPPAGVFNCMGPGSCCGSTCPGC